MFEQEDFLVEFPFQIRKELLRRSWSRPSDEERDLPREGKEGHLAPPQHEIQFKDLKEEKAVTLNIGS
jgi:hypothetical protein